MLKLDFDLSSLKIFLEVSKDCNMTAAAKRLSLSQPAVSSCITKMEQQLGVPLFDRSYRPIVLTQAGRILQLRSFEILQNIRDLSAEVIAANDGIKPDLRMASSDNISQCCVPYFMHKVLNHVHTLSTFTGHTPYVCDLLAQQKVDIAIATNPLYSKQNIQSIPLYMEDFLLVVPPNFQCRADSITDLQHLARHLPFIRFNKLSQDVIETERILRLFGIVAPQRIASCTNIMTMSLIVQGLGWSILPTLGIWSVKEFLNSVGIYKLKLTNVQRKAYLMYLDPFYKPLAETIAHELKVAMNETVIPNLKNKKPILAQSIQVISN